MKEVCFEGSLYWCSVFSLVQLNAFNDLIEEEKVHLASLWKMKLGETVNMLHDKIHIPK